MTLYRIPDIETHEDRRGSIGGWGFGDLHEEDTVMKYAIEDDDDMDRDQAQGVVERMVRTETGENGERRWCKLRVTPGL